MIRYLWEKFSATYFDEQTTMLMGEIEKLLAARKHRPFDPASAQYKQFCEKQIQKAEQLQEKHPGLDLTNLIAFFNEPLKSI
jgi:hypothetical protein